MNKNFVFDTAPTLVRRRTKLNLSYGVKTSGNVGDLIPFMLHEVLPGDTSFTVSNVVTRTTTALKTPIMDNLFLDTMYFYIPNRILMDEWESVVSGKQLPYNQEAETYTVPNVFGTNTAIKSGSLAEYLGIPLSDKVPSGAFASVLPFRAYALVWNEWFRDENLQSPKNILKGANDSPDEVIGSANFVDWFADVNNYTNVGLAKVSKLHDYFTSALPQPQKGDPVQIPLASNDAPVVTGDNREGLYDTSRPALAFYSPSVPTYGSLLGVAGDTQSRVVSTNVSTGVSATGRNSISLQPANLYADLGDVVDVSVNDLRTSFAIQRILERDSYGGTRYIEYLRSAFGVDAGDYRLQRPEYLGGSRNPIRVSQVNDTTNLDNQLGQVGAYSLSAGSARFSKSFVEHGWILGVMCVRQFHTYQQGLNKLWQRRSRFDFYDPAFAHLGEQPIYQSEIYLNSPPETVFGYQMANASYRYTPNIVTGQMRSDAPITFDTWHLADDYGNAPVLSGEFIRETDTFFNRVLQAPTSTGANQFIFDVWNAHECTRVMPFDPIPGLIDHN